MKRTLSKSRLMRGFQCKKSLYFALFHPELEEEMSESQEKIFADGSKVGVLAQAEFPNGILIEAEHHDYDAFIKKTKEAIKNGANAIFEAGLIWDSFFCRADILKRAPKNQWDLIEVKSTTSVKDVHIEDMAVQKIIAEKSGLKIRKTILMHLNRECIFPDLSNLFVQEDQTEEVDEILENTLERMQEMKKIAASKKTPAMDIGPHCNNPYDCPFQSECWSHIPRPSIFDIPKLRAWQYYDQGKIKIKDLKGEKLSASTTKFVNAHLTGKRFVDKMEIAKQVTTWKWPLTFLDFETISYAVPCLKGTSPYTQVPFQAACSVWKKPNSEIQELDYLNVESDDPRDGMAEYLVNSIPENGSVVAYNKGFEAGVLSALAKHSPKYKNKLLSIQSRLVDPLPIFRSHVYDAEFGATFSLKSVAPAILGKSFGYSGLEVKAGGDAQLAYLRIRDPQTPKKDRERLIHALEVYCRKDTELMRQIVVWLFSQK